MKGINKWFRVSEALPAYNEPDLCLLDNGQQIILAFDECSQQWVDYNEKELEDAHVIAWGELDSREDIEKRWI